ncbi:UNVERIFIED_CONTAM: hypothetical protein HDU68_006867 [Siphonaria sp. JEL0065]|nr:hypothetical protein HDU68_006867 [Siphonaria sp. JEL0065]
MQRRAETTFDTNAKRVKKTPRELPKESPAKDHAAVLQQVTAHACKSTITASLSMKTTSLATHSTSQMRTMLFEDGYLCVQALVPPKTVRKARDHVLNHLKDNAFVQPQTTDRIKSNLETSPNLLQNQKLAFSEQVANATAHQNIVRLISKLLEGSTTTPAPETDEAGSKAKTPPPHYKFPGVTQIPYSWLRAVSMDKCTGPHMDRVYLGAGSQNILTVWMPLTDVPILRGSLCVASKSHASEKMRGFREKYGSVPAGRDGTDSGWVTQFPDQIEELYGIGRAAEGGEEPGRIEWVTRDFEMGDVVIFGLDLLHMTLNNVTNSWRVSCETRWQPTGDAYPPFFHSKSQ